MWGDESNECVKLSTSDASLTVKSIPVSLCGLSCAEDQNRQAVTEAQLHSVVLRLGALLVLMLTVGHWADVLHVLMAFVGEAICLLPSQDLLRAAMKVSRNLQLGCVFSLTRRRNRKVTLAATTKSAACFASCDIKFVVLSNFRRRKTQTRTLPKGGIDLDLFQ